MKGLLGVRSYRFMFMSPWIVMSVVGCFAVIVSFADCRFVMKSGSWCGRLYILMMVWMTLFFCLFSCMCSMSVAVLGICVSSYVICMFFLWYTDMSGLCLCL